MPCGRPRGAGQGLLMPLRQEESQYIIAKTLPSRAPLLRLLLCDVVGRMVAMLLERRTCTPEGRSPELALRTGMSCMRPPL